jgi:transposase
MESTGSYSTELAVEITRQNPSMMPVIANARYVKKFGESLGQRCKADKADARVCAVFGADRRPAPWEAPQYQKLQELARERHALVVQQSALTNRSEGKNSELKLVKTIQKQLHQQLAKHIAKLDRAIDQEIKKIPELKVDAKRVKQIPGVGDVVAATIFAELGDLRKFLKGRSLAAMVGVNPRVIESGKHKGKTRMSKMGNARVRRVLFCAAMGCLKTKDDHCLKRFYQRLLQNGKTKMQALGALMRKILLLMRTLLINEKPFDPDYDLRG